MADDSPTSEVLAASAPESGGGSPPIPAGDPLAARLADARVGPYHLLRILGEGGFGVVYLAERREPFVQPVALKVLKPGMDSKAISMRFELERQALALMDHPGIAKVLDGGLTDESSRLGPGRPYFVMELVRGEPITEYCRARALTVPRRLELFLAVCDAVQHAHMKGVIHRDLKPSNILVSESNGRATPKVIDFGVAKAISTLKPEQTMTVTGQFIGTPEYMSPEQAAGESTDLDTRSDVYSLGVVLYRLLTGVLPFEPDELWQRGLLETMRVIREVEPPKPSTRVATRTRARASQGGSAAGGATVSSVSAAQPPEGAPESNTGEPPDTLARALRGDLDWICMRALEKARERRYQSPGALAADIRRHLRTEPVEAGPPDVSYRVGKFVRRNRALVGGAGLAAAALVVGLVMALVGLAEARAQRKEADRRRAEAETSLESALRQQQISDQTLDFVRKAMFVAAPSTGGDVSVLDLVRTMAANLFDGTNKAPAETRPSLLFQAGSLLRSFQDFTGAERCLIAARTEGSALGAAGVFDATRATVVLAQVRNDQGRAAEALGLLEEAIATLEASNAPDAQPWLMQALTTRATALQKAGRRAEAEAAFRSAISLVQARVGESSELLINPMLGLSSVLSEDPAKREEAAELAERALAMTESGAHQNDLLTVSAYNTAARARRDRGDLNGAADHYERVIGLARVVHPFPPATLAATQHNLAMIRREQGRLDEARTLVGSAIQTRRELAPGSIDLARSLNLLGLIEVDSGRLDRAEAIYREEIEILEEADTGPGVEVSRAQTGLADVLCREGRFEPAQRLAEQALATRKRALAPGDWPLLNTQSVLGAALAGLGEFDRAEALLQDALLKLEADPATTPARLRPVLERAVDLYTRWNKPERLNEVRAKLDKHAR